MRSCLNVVGLLFALAVATLVRDTLRCPGPAAADARRSRRDAAPARPAAVTRWQIRRLHAGAGRLEGESSRWSDLAAGGCRWPTRPAHAPRDGRGAVGAMVAGRQIDAVSRERRRRRHSDATGCPPMEATRSSSRGTPLACRRPRGRPMARPSTFWPPMRERRRARAQSIERRCVHVRGELQAAAPLEGERRRRRRGKADRRRLVRAGVSSVAGWPADRRPPCADAARRMTAPGAKSG